MTTDVDIMSEMLDRATTKDEQLDELSTQMFIMVVRSDPQLVHKAQAMIVNKLQSTDVTEATKAIEVLKECMSKCGTEFQDEIGKFRFLNSLIRLVSIKYNGHQTPFVIKQRIMECLLLWTTEYPEKLKIREVYDMLTKEGVTVNDDIQSIVSTASTTTTTTTTTIAENPLGIDEQVLKKLLNSNDPENFKRANLLIQHRVNQDARRSELHTQQRLLLQEAKETITLLNEMLEAFAVDDHKTEDASETVNLMRELYMSCKKHKTIMKGLPSLIDQADEDLIANTLETNDSLLAVMNRYKSTIVHSPMQQTKSSKESTLPHNTNVSNSDLLLQLLGDIPAANSDPTPVAATLISKTSASPAKPSSATSKKVDGIHPSFDELNEIFTNTETKHSEDNGIAAKNLNELFGNLDLLQPVNVFNTTADETHKLEDEQNDANGEKRGLRELREIDLLSEELFKQSLPQAERVGTFKKEPERVSLNDLAKERQFVGKPEVSPRKKFNIIKTSSVAASAAEAAIEDDQMLTTDIEETKNPLTTTAAKETEQQQQAAEKIVVSSTVADDHGSSGDHVERPFKKLAEIEIDLESVTPTSEERLLLNDDDIKITLNFTENRPCLNVSVIVISVFNKSKMPLKDFIFEASVKKPSKVRLLKSTGNTLTPYRPFPPPTPINQVMLLLNPTKQSVDVTCIVGYKLGDDLDAIKEAIIAKDIPYVE